VNVAATDNKYLL